MRQAQKLEETPKKKKKSLGAAKVAGYLEKYRYLNQNNGCTRGKTTEFLAFILRVHIYLLELVE